MSEQLGSIPLSSNILKETNIGLWAFELDENMPPRMYVDNTMQTLLGIKEPLTPEQTFHAWFDHVDVKSHGIVQQTIDKMIAGEHAEAQYPWHHPEQGLTYVRCGGIRNFAYTKGIRLEGVHQDITEILHFQLEAYSTFSSLFLENYITYCYLNLDTGKRIVYRKDASLTEEQNSSSDYFNWFKEYIDHAVHPDDREFLRKISAPDYIKQRMNEETKFSVRFRNISGDSPRICNLEIIRGAEHNHVAFGIKDIEDAIQEQRQQQKTLEEALCLSQVANKAKTTFLNNMSHDIRTPMNAIIGFTALAASHIDNKDQVQTYLSKIGKSSEHLLSLINDVLDMSRIESGKMNLSEKEENLSEIIHTIKDITLAEVKRKDMDLFIDTLDISDEDIICDKLRLNQVLINTLSNAIKFTPAHGLISLRVLQKTTSETGYGVYEFHVKDNGIGMEKSFLKTIFDPFTRAKTSTISGLPGTGLGMTITKSIVDMMGGTIEVLSEENQGTEVIITFNFKLQKHHKISLKIDKMEGVRSLVVDDDLNACLGVSKMLREVGMRSEWCSSGKEAVIRTEESLRLGDLFKVFIIDWLIPDMNGIETARRIRRIIGDNGAIIILTAYDWSDIEEEALAAGVTTFISKPLFPSDLHKILLQCCEGKNEEPQKPRQLLSLKGKKILLVEDNVMNQEIAAGILEDAGAQVKIVSDGIYAVEELENSVSIDYDLVLMDIQMPIMDGYEATKRIRALPNKNISQIPIVAMTADAFEEDRKMALEAGMDAHIAKPINFTTMNKILKKYL